MVKTLKLSQINFESGTQARIKLDTDVVSAYTESLQDSNGASLPPVDVYSDGTDYWLSDGFHRLHAHRNAGLGTIKANVHAGTKRDAVLASVGANAEHGLKRSNADKRKAVKILLADDEWKQKSDRWIADKAKVSHTFVSALRGESGGNVASAGTEQSGNVASADNESGGNVATSGQSEGGESHQLSDVIEEPEIESPASIVKDCCGRDVPEPLREAHSAAYQLNAIGRELDKLKRLTDELSGQPGGEFLSSSEISMNFKSLKDAIVFSGYMTECPRCQRESTSCRTCCGNGWIPRSKKGHLTPAERDTIGGV